MPTSYGDFGKAAGDLLNKEYQFNNKLKATTKTANGVKITTEGVMAGNKSILAKTSAAFTHSSGIKVDKLQVTTDGRVVGEFSLNGVVDGASFNFKCEDGNAGANAKGKAYKQKGSVGVEYGTDALNFEGTLDVVNGPTVSANTVFSYDKFLFGGDFSYNTQFDDENSDAGLTGFGAKVAYNTSDATYVFSAGNKFDAYSLSVHQKVDSDTTVALQADYGAKKQSKSLTLGGSYRMDRDTELQGKVNSAGQVSFNFLQQVSPKVKLGASVALDATNFASDNHNFGMALTLG